MEGKSSIKDTNGNIVENLDDFEKSFEFFYKTLLKLNPPKNIFELHKEISVNQQFTQC